jgi:hypothetical protein
MHAHGLFRPADVYEQNTLSRISQSKRCCIPFKPEMATNFTRNTSAGFINGHMEDAELEDPELNGPQVSPTRDMSHGRENWNRQRRQLRRDKPASSGRAQWKAFREHLLVY